MKMNKKALPEAKAQPDNLRTALVILLIFMAIVLLAFIATTINPFVKPKVIAPASAEDLALMHDQFILQANFPTHGMDIQRLIFQYKLQHPSNTTQ